ncbi:hypothetical protein [Bordetella hinzii]|uniref:hypothetical protein n=1 Tax=Bordetella hinzii TaxID=103855 RepID=UPI001153BC16|nr:hypothetical protein [Bordetella hinzii]
MTWTNDENRATRPDLVIHLVQPEHLRTVSNADLRRGQWEPATEMRRGFRRGDKEIALVMGSAHLLPQKRYGCWIAAGRRSAVEALQIIARTLIEPAMASDSAYQWNLHDLAEANVLCTLATENADSDGTLARKVIAAVGTVLGLSHTTPTRIIVAAPDSIIANVATAYPTDRERVHLINSFALGGLVAANLLVAYPWPARHLK